MSESLHRWKSFWDDKTVPLHRQDSDEHYVPLAGELRILFQDAEPNRVLEIGCGNGALYGHLGFNRADAYTGVDFSQSMLDRFRQQYPGVALVAASGHNYRDEHQYDLIFSNGVVQYFDRRMLAEHVQHAATMLAPAGKIVCASVPWKCFRARYLQGRFARQPAGFAKWIAGWVRYPLRDSMGRWFEWRDFEELGRRHGLAARFYGSLHYPYRFHVVLERDCADRSVPKAA